MPRIAWRTVSVAFAVVAAAGQVDITKLGPQPGGQAVDFQLPDQHGKPRTLASLAGPKGTMLVFFRSADW